MQEESFIVVSVKQTTEMCASLVAVISGLRVFAQSIRAFFIC